MVVPATRKMTIIAQDPSIKDSNQKILRTQVSIPYEQLGPGPRGYRVHVVDYDSSHSVSTHDNLLLICVILNWA